MLSPDRLVATLCDKINLALLVLDNWFISLINTTYSKLVGADNQQSGHQAQRKQVEPAALASVLEVVSEVLPHVYIMSVCCFL